MHQLFYIISTLLKCLHVVAWSTTHFVLHFFFFLLLQINAQIMFRKSYK